MGRVKNRQFWESASMNNKSFNQYYMRLMELAISSFKWKNLPDSIDSRFMELILFANGQAVFFRDEVMGELCLMCTIGGRLNVYNIPTDRTAYASNGYNKHLTENDSVIIYNNMIHQNSMLDVEMFAKRLYNIDRTIDTNVNAQKTPVLVLADETQRLVMKNLYMKYEGNEPFIFGDKSLDMNNIKVLKTDAPYLADKLFQLKTDIWNEALTYLGISNISYQKKERLITDEVQRGQGGVIASRNSRLATRKQACEQINKMFGLNIDVEFNDTFLDDEDKDNGREDFEVEEIEENRIEN